MKQRRAFAVPEYGPARNARGMANDEPRNMDAFYRRRLPRRADRHGGGMSGLAELFREYWAVIMTAVWFGIWLVRLESRSIAIEKELERMAKQRAEDLKNAEKSREDTKETLTEMKDDMKVIRSDIKTLLSRHS